MNNEREQERLHQMFAGIEVLAVRPAGPTVEIQPEAEIPTIQLVEIQEPVVAEGNASLEAELALAMPTQAEQQGPDELTLRENNILALELTTTSQVEQQDSGGMLLPKNDQRGALVVKDDIESSVESTLHRAGISNAEPLIALPQGQDIVESSTALPHNASFTTDETHQPDLGAVGIGVLVGSIVTGIILASTSQMHIFNNVGRIFLLGWEILCGVIGALAAKKRTRRDAWMGAIQWSLIPVWIVLAIISVVYLLMVTNFFGV